MPSLVQGAEPETLSSPPATDSQALPALAPARAARTRLVISDDRRAEVADLAGKGVPRGVIARMLGISPRTLRRHFGRELEMGAARAHARIVETLYAKALEGHAPSLIFWCRVRLGWGGKPGEADDGGPLEGEGEGYGPFPRSGGAASPPIEPVALESLNDAQLEALLRRLEAAGFDPGPDGGSGGD
ncbi:helix-turn-helix domain-containing protein [Nitrospirillum sp. BR 11164]|uniref:helix-turn-helix domain-containing protein n=1 Tax=Nitrospirillum sp. BR 11164 TaxID=3104324 RepID=UPI002AFFB768|nr:helix-turn-helix domain-containing protein [Nitrospirillum sp. BR 11164]MEA1651822.1 helix-turn-helix domain-containing protein [Nitrospirillum sp. BR 11164]